jgi:RNA polymerase sigma factor (sigma-70 family)
MERNRGSLHDDQYLVKRVLGGDTNAFSAIIKDTQQLVASIVFKMISNPEERKDISQDIYLKAFHKLNGFKFESKLSTWIAQIAFNTCRSYLEKKKMILIEVNHFSAHDAPGNFNNHQPHVDIFQNETENHIYNQELAAIMTILIEELPVLHKTLITLYHQEDLSYSEIAQITELPEGTVKSYLFRARKALKDNLVKKNKNDLLWPINTSVR